MILYIWQKLINLFIPAWYVLFVAATRPCSKYHWTSISRLVMSNLVWCWWRKSNNGRWSVAWLAKTIGPSACKTDSMLLHDNMSSAKIFAIPAMCEAVIWNENAASKMNRQRNKCIMSDLYDCIGLLWWPGCHIYSQLLYLVTLDPTMPLLIQQGWVPSLLYS